MAKRNMTNIERVTHMMSFSNYGALKQVFMIEALHSYANACAKATPAEVGNALISGEAWIGVAQEVQKDLASVFTIDDPELDDERDLIDERRVTIGANGQEYVTNGLGERIS